VSEPGVSVKSDDTDLCVVGGEFAYPFEKLPPRSVVDDDDFELSACPTAYDASQAGLKLRQRVPGNNDDAYFRRPHRILRLGRRVSE
jgi:hypothetical protein